MSDKPVFEYTGGAFPVEVTYRTASSFGKPLIGHTWQLRDGRVEIESGVDCDFNLESGRGYEISITIRRKQPD